MYSIVSDHFLLLRVRRLNLPRLVDGGGTEPIGICFGSYVGANCAQPSNIAIDADSFMIQAP